MSNFFEYRDTVAFHPGYYIKEIIEEKGMTQEEFARRLNTTPKNLSLLVRGEQNLSVDIAIKLSRLLGTSIAYWLNLQNAYDSLVAEYQSDQELKEEGHVLESLDYRDFLQIYSLSGTEKSKEAQIGRIRSYLNLASLTSLKKKNMAAVFHPSGTEDSDIRTVRANATVQVAVNLALEAANALDIPPYNKRRFRRDAQNALSLTTEQGDVCLFLQKAFLEAGVIFIPLPVLSESEVRGAVRKVGSQILLMLSEDSLSSDLFWYRLYSEIGNILFGDYGITFEAGTGERQNRANRYAEDALISPAPYQEFVHMGNFDAASVAAFSAQIGRTPGIVLGRLQRDGCLRAFDRAHQSLLCRYPAGTAEIGLRISASGNG